MEFTTLNNGIKMPMAGIGVFMMSPSEAEASVESALKCGVRLIDTANGYMNESGTGSGSGAACDLFSGIPDDKGKNLHRTGNEIENQHF